MLAGRIRDDTAYRRGVIFGLTVAEMMVLLVFLVLLSAAALFGREDRELQNLGHEYQTALAERAHLLVAAAQNTETQARLKSVEGELDAARRRAGIPAGYIKDLEQRLMEQQAHLREQQELLRRLNEMLSALQIHSDGLEERLANLIKDYHQALAELAQAKSNGAPGLPLCWMTPKGDPIYMLRITLRGASVRDTTVSVADVNPRPRPEDPGWSLIQNLPRERSLPVSEFLIQTAPLGQRSTALKCRYAAEVVDQTATGNKSGYKTAINELWKMFYLHEVPSSP